MHQSKDRPRLLFLEQFYFPEGWGGAELPRDLTMHLAQSGFNVEVICGTDQYASIPSSVCVDPTSVGVRIRRIPRLIPGPAKSLKLIRQSWFYLCLAILLLRAPRPALLIAQTNPPLGVWLAAVAARLRGTRLLVIAQDLYPEVLIAHGSLRPSGVIAKFLGSLFGWAYRSAERVVALGPVMVERIAAKGVDRSRVVTISNWATGPQEVVRGHSNRLVVDWELSNKFVVLYSGNVGIGHEFETLLLAIQRLAPRCPELRLVIVGQGSRLEEVRCRVRELGVDAVVLFKPLVPSDRLSESLGLADIAVVTLRPGFEGLIVPSKQLGYMARGIPTLYIGPRSDVAALIADSKGGVVCAHGDVSAVEEALLEALRSRDSLNTLGMQALEYYRRHLTRDQALAQYLDLARRMTEVSLS